LAGQLIKTRIQKLEQAIIDANTAAGHNNTAQSEETAVTIDQAPGRATSDSELKDNGNANPATYHDVPRNLRTEPASLGLSSNVIFHSSFEPRIEDDKANRTAQSGLGLFPFSNSFDESSDWGQGSINDSESQVHHQRRQKLFDVTESPIPVRTKSVQGDENTSHRYGKSSGEVMCLLCCLIAFYNRFPTVFQAFPKRIEEEV
jgi:hypothetical protein